MITINELVDIVANEFFSWSIEIAGLALFSIVMGLLFALTRDVFQTLMLSLPVTFIFSSFGFLPNDLVILLIIVAVLGLAMSAKRLWDRR